MYYGSHELLYYMAFPLAFGVLYFLGKKNYLLLLVAWIPIGVLIGFGVMSLMKKYPALYETEVVAINSMVVLCMVFELVYEAICTFTKSRG